MEKSISLEDILSVEPFYRRHLINTITGFKGVHLIGTVSHRGTTNLGVFNSVVHLGATPPLLAFIIRPLTVPRHTYHNIKARGYFTINHIHEEILKQAHQTSANYDVKTSEFEAAGLTPQYTDTHPAPYVRESRIKLGLEYVEEHHIRANDTIMLVGKIVEILLPEEALTVNGHLRPERWGSLGVVGLDAYYRAEKVAQMEYARPERQPSE